MNLDLAIKISIFRDTYKIEKSLDDTLEICENQIKNGCPSYRPLGDSSSEIMSRLAAEQYNLLVSEINNYYDLQRKDENKVKPKYEVAEFDILLNKLRIELPKSVRLELLNATKDDVTLSVVGTIKNYLVGDNALILYDIKFNMIAIPIHSIARIYLPNEWESICLIQTLIGLEYHLKF